MYGEIDYEWHLKRICKVLEEVFADVGSIVYARMGVIGTDPPIRTFEYGIHIHAPGYMEQRDRLRVGADIYVCLGAEECYEKAQQLKQDYLDKTWV